MATINRPPLVFAGFHHTKLFHGFHNGEVFLFRVWRTAQESVSAEMMEQAGLNPDANPTVYFVARDTWTASSPAWRTPSLYLAGPLTIDGAAAVARSFTEAYDRNTNYGAF